MPPITRLEPIDSSSFGIAHQARLQDEERAIREDEAHFRATGVNRMTSAAHSDVADVADPRGEMVEVNGIQINKYSESYLRWKDRDDKIKDKAFKKLVKQMDEELYDNAISALDL